MHYEPCGHGTEVILCLSGGTGTAHVDFSPQLEYFSVQNESRYTAIVAVNALGYAWIAYFNLPRETFPFFRPDHFLKTDTINTHELMKKLTYDRSLILGWSSGGASAIIMAALFSESVKKVVASLGDKIVHHKARY